MQRINIIITMQLLLVLFSIGCTPNLNTFSQQNSSLNNENINKFQSNSLQINTTTESIPENNTAQNNNNQKKEITSLNNTTCEESDQGIDYMTAGTINFCRSGTECITQIDYCIDNNELIEYYCQDDALMRISHSCEPACNKGECQKAEPTPPIPVSEYEDHALVLESKSLIIKYGFSPQFFENHFKLAYFSDNITSNSRITWKFSFEPYTAELEDRLGYRREQDQIIYIHGLAPAPNLELPVISDFKTVIPQSEADNLMRSCIGEFANAHAELKLIGSEIGLFYIANPKENPEICPTSGEAPCIIRQGIIDLVNGKVVECSN